MQIYSIELNYPKHICILSVYFCLKLATTCLCMISLRVSATKLANTNQIENPRGFS